jgi:hypothetical protein
MRPTRMPLGRCVTPVISPIGSGISASCRQPSMTVCSACASRRSRSSSGAARPASAAARRSWALAVSSSAPASRRRTASARKAASRFARGEAAIRAAALRAAAPSKSSVAVTSISVMGRLSVSRQVLPGGADFVSRRVWDRHDDPAQRRRPALSGASPTPGKIAAAAGLTHHHAARTCLAHPTAGCGQRDGASGEAGAGSRCCSRSPSRPFRLVGAARARVSACARTDPPQESLS